MSYGSTDEDLPTQLRSPIPEASIEDLDAPAYTRALTPLPELERRQAMRMSDREDVSNRTFNQQFWST
jgi:hypothetical protein